MFLHCRGAPGSGGTAAARPSRRTAASRSGTPPSSSPRGDRGQRRGSRPHRGRHPRSRRQGAGRTECRWPDSGL